MQRIFHCETILVFKPGATLLALLWVFCIATPASAAAPASWETISNRWASLSFSEAMSAAETGDATAQYYVGRSSLVSRGFKVDTNWGVQFIQKAADQQLAVAQNHIGYLYSTGQGLPRDQAKAIEWFRKAAAQGLPVAINNLSMVSNTVDRAMSDPNTLARMRSAIPPEFRTLLDQAIKGEAAAQYELAIQYADQRNMNEAAAWMQKAAEQGHVRAQVKMGEYTRWVFRKGREEIIKWYRMAAEQGDPEGQYEYGYQLFTSTEDKTQKAEAIAWVRKAAEQGYYYACRRLGEWAYKGDGMNQDFSEAAKWYEKAANFGDSVAPTDLGDMFMEGKGVEKNPTTAAKWYRTSANGKWPMGMIKYAGCLFNGMGTAKDPAAAFQWYQKAAQKNYEQAQMGLAKCYAQGLGAEKNLKEALRYYELAAERRHAPAMLELSRCYAEGLGVKQNYETAFQWCEKAIKLGNNEAETLGFALLEKVNGNKGATGLPITVRPGAKAPANPSPSGIRALQHSTPKTLSPLLVTNVWRVLPPLTNAHVLKQFLSTGVSRGNRYWMEMKLWYSSPYNSPPAALFQAIYCHDCTTGADQWLPYPNSTTNFGQAFAPQNLLQRQFEVVDGKVFLCSSNKLLMASLAKPEWKETGIVLTGQTFLHAVNQRLYLAGEKTILEADPNTYATKVMASSQRKPSECELDRLDDYRHALFMEGGSPVVLVHLGSTIRPWDSQKALWGAPRKVIHGFQWDIRYSDANNLLWVQDAAENNKEGRIYRWSPQSTSECLFARRIVSTAAGFMTCSVNPEQVRWNPAAELKPFEANMVIQGDRVWCFKSNPNALQCFSPRKTEPLIIPLTFSKLETLNSSISSAYFAVTPQGLLLHLQDSFQKNPGMHFIPSTDLEPLVTAWEKEN